MKSFFERYGANFAYILIFAIIILFFVKASRDYEKVVNNNLLREARLIGYQIEALRNYIQSKQDTINKDASGAYDFKGLYPDIAVKEIAEIYKSNPSLIIRQVSLAPRNEDNAPDAFESVRLQKFKDNPELPELFGNGSINGSGAFRYMFPLRALPTCMPCHGEPKGDIDVTGYNKEGYKVGEIIGAVSIMIPSYEQRISIRNNTSLLLAFVFLMTIAISIVIYSIKKDYEKRLAEMRVKERTEPVTASPLNAMDAQMSDKFHKLLIYNLRNPAYELIDSANLLKDVPLNVLESSLAASNKISAYETKLVELKKLELGKYEILLETYDFEPAFKAKLKIYEATALKNKMKFDGKMGAGITKITADKNLMFKAIDYLFLSILKFTKKIDGELSVTLSNAAAGDALVITMKNNSARINATCEPLIFERFADIRDSKGNFLFNTDTELAAAKHALYQLNCGLLFDTGNKESNVFNIVIPIRKAV